MNFERYIPNDVYRISRDPALLNKVDCPSPCYLWQKTFDVISHPRTPAFPLRCRVRHYWVNRARFPQLDQQAIKIQPLPTNFFSNGPTQVRTGVDQFGRDVNRDSSKISTCGIKKSPVFDPRVSSSSAHLVVPSSSAVSRSLVLSVLSLFVTHRRDPRTRTGPAFLPKLIHSPALQRY